MLCAWHQHIFCTSLRKYRKINTTSTFGCCVYIETIALYSVHCTPIRAIILLILSSTYKVPKCWDFATPVKLILNIVVDVRSCSIEDLFQLAHKDHITGFMACLYQASPKKVLFQRFYYLLAYLIYNFHA